MPRAAWLTGNTITATDFICRRVRIPNDFELITAVNGALLSLIYAYNWEQFGAATPEQTAALMQTMFYEYIESDVCMIGTIQAYATVDPPNGCLPCDGSQFDRVDYPRLYERLDPLLIVDADHFRTPDLRQRHLLAAGDAPGLTERSFGDVGGEEAHTLTVAELAEHDHTTQPHTHTAQPHTHTDTPHTHTNTPHVHSDLGHSHSEVIAVPAAVFPGELPVPIPTATPSPGITGIGVANIQASGVIIDAASVTLDNADVVIDDSTVTVDAAGAGEAHNNMPPFYVVRYCIVAR